MSLAAGERYVWIVIVLFGSLLEAAYLFRWFGQALHARTSALPRSSSVALLRSPEWHCCLRSRGYISAMLAGLTSSWVFIPLVAGLVLCLLDGLPGRIKCLIALALVLVGGIWLIPDSSGLNYLFAVLLLAGGSGCIDRLLLSIRPTARLLPASHRHAAFAAGAATRIDQS